MSINISSKTAHHGKHSQMSPNEPRTGDMSLCHEPELDTRIDDGNNHELCIIFTPVFMMVIVVKSMITSILCSLGIIYLGGGPGLLVCLHRDYIVPSVPVMQRSGHGWRVIAPLQPCHVSCVMAHGSYHAGDQGEDHLAHQAGQLGAKHPDQKYTHHRHCLPACIK